MTIDEQRQAWRAYSAALVAVLRWPINDMADVGQWADALMEEERKRFDQPDHSGDANKMVEPPAWVSAQFRPLDLSMYAPFVNTGQPPEPRPWVGLTDAERSVIWDDCCHRSMTVFSTIKRVEEMLRAKNGGTR